jgi:tRNA 2-thiouridine synthesizing protein A
MTGERADGGGVRGLPGQAEASGGGRPICERFLEAIAGRDFPGMASCLGGDLRFRALVPRGLRQASGVEEPVRCFQGWFGAAERVELLHGSVSAVADRQHLTWRLRVYDAGAVRVVEQQAYATVRDGRIAELDLLCSGFRSEPAPHSRAGGNPAPVTPEVAARLDGGDAGCAALTPLVKQALRGLQPFEVLEVATREPTAAQDLAAWCALTGHTLISANPEGALTRFHIRKKRGGNP